MPGSTIRRYEGKQSICGYQMRPPKVYQVFPHQPPCVAVGGWCSSPKQIYSVCRLQSIIPSTIYQSYRCECPQRLQRCRPQISHFSSFHRRYCTEAVINEASDEMVVELGCGDAWTDTTISWCSLLGRRATVDGLPPEKQDARNTTPTTQVPRAD